MLAAGDEPELFTVSRSFDKSTFSMPDIMAIAVVIFAWPAFVCICFSATERSLLGLLSILLQTMEMWLSTVLLQYFSSEDRNKMMRSVLRKVCGIISLEIRVLSDDETHVFLFFDFLGCLIHGCRISLKLLFGEWAILKCCLENFI